MRHFPLNQLKKWPIIIDNLFIVYLKIASRQWFAPDIVANAVAMADKKQNKEWRMRERRNAQRKKTNELIRVYCMKTGELIGQVINLSIMGINIQAVQNMDVGSIYKFKIDLAMSVEEKRSLALEAKCVWCREDSKSNGNYDIGFQISEMMFDKIEEIQSLLDDARFYDAEEQPRLALAKKST